MPTTLKRALCCRLEGSGVGAPWLLWESGGVQACSLLWPQPQHLEVEGRGGEHGLQSQAAPDCAIIQLLILGRLLKLTVPQLSHL